MNTLQLVPLRSLIARSERTAIRSRSLPAACLAVIRAFNHHEIKAAGLESGQKGLVILRHATRPLPGLQAGNQ